MATNDRIFYAVQAVIIKPTGRDPNANGVVKGLQSVGMNSTFTLDQIFEIGQLEIYENVENVADVDVSLTKVIDGETLIWTHASFDGTSALCRTDIVAASKNRVDVYLGIFDDGVSNATGVPRNVCWNSGMYTSEVSYSYTVDGNAEESVTLVGNEKFWNSDANQTGDTATNQWGVTDHTAVFDGSDVPASGVVRRVDFDAAGSTVPPILTTQQGTLGAAQENMHWQSINVSASFGQENITELGRFGPYAKYATYPIEVTSDFEIIATSGDVKSVSGISENLENRQIVLKDTAGTVINLGTKNKLSSISYSGGDTGGGNATITYSFSNFNSLTVHDSSAITD